MRPMQAPPCQMRRDAAAMRELYSKRARVRLQVTKAGDGQYAVIHARKSGLGIEILTLRAVKKHIGIIVEEEQYTP